MSNGIAHNNLNDISKIYLETISDINKKEQADDVKRWQKEETECKKETPFKKRKNKDLPFTDDVSETKYQREAFSNWRATLREVTSDAEAVEIDDQPEIKEKKVKNKIKINPEFKEAVKQMGGELLEVTEVDDKKKDPKADADAYKEKQMSDKEKKLKLRILRVKMMAAKQGADSSIVAGYEPDIEGAIEYFYEEGINEEGIDQLIEEIGLDEFVNFIEGGTVELNEERAARRATVRAKSYEKVKAEVDKSDAAKRKAKKGEYAPSYAKKETDVTVYDDDKPAAKKKAAPAKKATAPKKPVAPKKPAAPKKPVTKKVVKAVAKVKKTQPKKKATKQGLGDKIRSAYKAGVKRHRKATQVPRVLHKGMKAGAKKAVKFVKDVHKAVNEEELRELNRYGKETGKATGSLNKRAGTPVKSGGDKDSAVNVVRRMIRKDYGRPEGQRKKEKGVKSDAGTGKYLAKQKSKKDYAARAKKAGYKNPQDYTNVVARYGGEDNYRKGKGLGT